MFVHAQSEATLSFFGMDSDIVGKLKLSLTAYERMVKMAITLIAFIVVVLAVNLLIRTRMFDYAWRIAFIAGGVIYILVILAEMSEFLEFR